MAPGYRVAGKNDSQEIPVAHWTPPIKYEGDPVAKLVRWTPCAPITDIDALPKMFQISGDSIEFRFDGEDKMVVGGGCLAMSVTLLAWFVWLAFKAVGKGAVPLVARFGSGIGALLGIPMCVYFVWYVVARELPRLTKPTKFDKTSGYRVNKGNAFSARRGKARSRRQRLGFSGPHQGPLNSIHALQIVREAPMAGVRSAGPHGYELNLVLGTGERVNVFDTTNVIFLQRYVTRIQKLVEVPIWDDSGRGYWKYDSNVGEAPRDGKAAAWMLGKAIWLGITGRGQEIGTWVWVASEDPGTPSDAENIERVEE